MNQLTELEKSFIETMFVEAYGGTLFTSDINPEGMSKAQKSGVVSSLVQKNFLVVPEDGMIGLVGDEEDDEYEITRASIEDLLTRRNK